MDYQQLQNALRTLGLGDRATRQQIKARHRDLVKQYHPDHGASDPVQMQHINAAYQVLESYCDNYRYCFSEEEFLEQVPEERLRRQFGADPVWGGTDGGSDD